MPMRLRRRGSWGTRPQTRTSRASSTSLTPSPGGAERCKKLYVMYGGSSELIFGGMLKPYAERFSR
jgi:hypothetical protein